MIVTTPVLAVCPAGITSVLLLLSVKSPATAGATPSASTSTVIATSEAWLDPAVTVATPLFSAMEFWSSASVTFGASAKVTVTGSAVTVR